MVDNATTAGSLGQVNHFRPRQILSTNLAQTTDQLYIGALMFWLKVIPMFSFFIWAFGLSHASAAESPDVGQQRPLYLRHIPSCPTCPDWELSFFADGTSKFLGRDAVRFIGENGTIFDAEKMRREESDNPGLKLNDRWLIDAELRLRRVLGEVNEYVKHNGSLKGLNSQDKLPDLAGKDRYELKVQLPGSGEQVVQFIYQDAGTRELAGIVDQIKALYFSPDDWLPAPAFFSDQDAVFLSSETWVGGKNPICAFVPLDYIMVAYKSGKVKIQGRVYDDGNRRSPFVRAEINLGSNRIISTRNALEKIASTLRQKRDEWNSPIGTGPMPRFDNPQAHVWRHYHAVFKTSDQADAVEFSGAGGAYAQENQKLPPSLVDYNAIIHEATRLLGKLPPDIQRFCKAQPERL